MTTRARGQGVDLGFGVNAYVSLGMAGFFALLPWTAGVAPVIGLLGGFDSGAGSSSPSLAVMAGPLAAFATVIAPWLVPCLVLRARQPKGARIEWNDDEIVEWDGPWKRNAIRWEHAEGAHLVWQVATRYGHHSRIAIQVFDKTNQGAVITAWEMEPKDAPTVRRRLEASKLSELDSVIHSRCGHGRAFDMARVADPDRVAQSAIVRWVARLGYIAGFFGPLLAGENPALGVSLSVVATILLAWRAAPAIRELFSVRAKLADRPEEMPAQADPYRDASAAAPSVRDAGEILAWRYRFRAVLAEALVRGAFVILPIAGAVASVLTDYR